MKKTIDLLELCRRYNWDYQKLLELIKALNV